MHHSPPIAQPSARSTVDDLVQRHSFSIAYSSLANTSLVSDFKLSTLIFGPLRSANTFLHSSDPVRIQLRTIFRNHDNLYTVTQKRSAKSTYKIARIISTTPIKKSKCSIPRHTIFRVKPRTQQPRPHETAINVMKGQQ